MTSSRFTYVVQRWRYPALLAVVVALSGCGPVAAKSYGLRHVGVNVVFGVNDDKSVQPNIGAASVPLPIPVSTGGNTIGTQSQAVVHALPPVVDNLPAPKCPKASPFAVPKSSAGTQINEPPKTGTYTYFERGLVQRGSDATKKKWTTSLALPSLMTMTVADVSVTDPPNTPFSNGPIVSWTENFVEGKTAASVSLKQDPVDTTDPWFPYPSATGGLQVLHVANAYSGETTFDPQPFLRIFDTPAQGQPPQAPDSTIPRNYNYAGVSATDPSRKLSISWMHQTVKSEKVDVCGTPIFAWLVNFSGTVSQTGGAISLAFKGSFHIAPQFGGLVSDENVTIDGTDGVGPASEPYVHYTRTINLASVTPGTAH